MSINDVIPYWFPNDKYQDFWFNGERDREITLTFKPLLEKLIQEPNLNHRFETIIVLDQFARNISRYENDKLSRNENQKIKPKLCLIGEEIAFRLSSELLEEGYDKKLSISQRLFLLMPYRHSARRENDSNLLDIVCEKLKEYKQEFGHTQHILRFESATYSSYTPLTDQITRYVFESGERTVYDYDTVLDPVYKTYGGEPQDTLSYLYQRVGDFIVQNGLTNKNIGISLSGGVDSMSLLFILKYLEVKNIISKVVALHLEYSNRQESAMETEMLGMYCSAVEIPLYTRVIDYMSRDSVDRSFYEEETKNVRFATYRHLSEKLKIAGWCLGHISDDISENVVMNLCSGRDLLDLKVMDKISILDGVSLFRPFLDTKKEDIYEFAHTYSIPYFKDTTPDWSSRGVLRRKVIPELKSQWPTVMNTLANIGERANEWKEVVEKFVMEPIKKEIILKNNMVDIPFKEEYVRLPEVIWTNLFLHIFHGMGVRMISHKNLKYFMEMLSKNMNKFHFSNKCQGIFLKNKENTGKIFRIFKLET